MPRLDIADGAADADQSSVPSRSFRRYARRHDGLRSVAMTADMPLVERLLALWDHLGLARAHVASQIPADLADLAARHPARVAGLVLCTPVRLDPGPFAAVAARTLMISGDSGLTAEATARAATRLPGAERLVLERYEA